MLDHVTAGNLDLAGQPQPIIELQDEEDDAGHSGRPGSDHQQSDQLGPDLLNSNGLNSITWYLVFLLRHELNIYCQAQAQVRLSLRLTQAHSGSLWLSLALTL